MNVEILTELQQCSGFAFDVETSSVSGSKEDNLNFRKCFPIIFGFTFLKEEKLITRQLIPSELDPLEIEQLSHIFQDKNILKIGHNITFDCKVVWKFFKDHFLDVGIEGIWMETVVAANLIDENVGHELGELMKQNIPYPQYPVYTKRYTKKHELHVKARKHKIYASWFNRLLKHNQEDTINTYLLAKKQKEQLITLGLWDWYQTYEMGTVKQNLDTEIKGAYFELDVLTKLLVEYMPIRQGCLDIILKSTDKDFNPNSPKQVIKYLYGETNEIRAPQHFTKKTRRMIKKTPSTDSEALEYWAKEGVEFAKNLLEYRKINKLIEFLNILIEHMTLYGRVYSTFNTHGTKTGRDSSKNPNLLNIPKEGRGVEIRKALQGNFVILDFSQEELRILAHFIGKGRLFEAYKNNEDIHKLTASLLFGVKLDVVTSEQRDIGKLTNLSIAYGRNSEYTDTWFEMYPEVREYRDSIIGEWVTENCEWEKTPGTIIRWKNYQGKIGQKGSVYETGYVTTITGRRRRFPDITKLYANWTTYHSYDEEGKRNKKELLNKILHQERQAFNAIFQGTAADVIKVARTNLHQVRGVKQIVLSVYDELIIEIEPELYGNNLYLYYIKDLALKANEVFKFNPKLDVDIKFCKDWASK